jgi:hypothetical protein
MEEMRLPVLGNDATVNDALQALKQRRCSALVVDRPSGAVVLEVDLILRALWQRGNVALEKIEPRLRTEHLSPGERPSEPSHPSKAFGSLEVAESVVYLPKLLPDREVVVLTPWETYTYLGAAPRLFRCPRDGDDESWFAHELIQPGDLCRKHYEPTRPIK